LVKTRNGEIDKRKPGGEKRKRQSELLFVERLKDYFVSTYGELAGQAS